LKKIFFSPAKINLFLLVLGKREDGYHEIASLIQAISLFDVLSFEFGEKDVLHCSDSRLDIGPSNLIWKAVSLFRQKTSINQPLEIYLQKNIPTMSGLGGGSSNAATTLFALDQIFDAQLLSSDFFALGQKIGSDVPSFFSLGTAYVEGRGEKVESVNLQSMPGPFYLSFSEEGLSTPLVYQSMVGKIDPNSTPKDHLQKAVEGHFSFTNDLEKGAFSLSPPLGEKKKKLEKEFSTVFLTGSGSAFVCMKPKEQRSTLLEVSAVLRKEKKWYSFE
jgi:4-diphosphocytidyl-2-C-methyl-D-erythritol kinase